MKLLLEIDLDTASPNRIGETLREITFVGGPHDYGCYTTFDVRSDAVELSNKDVLDFFYDECINRGSNETDAIDFIDDMRHGSPQGYTYSLQGGDIIVECYWYWDGDGTLIFAVTDTKTGEEKQYENTDCKKSNTWEVM